jgi:DNA-binding transcriptional regulator YiaG
VIESVGQLDTRDAGRWGELSERAFEVLRVSPYPAEFAQLNGRATRSILFANPIQDEPSTADVTALREKLGPDVKTFARVMNISERTARQLESGAKPVKGPLMRLVQLLRRDPQVADALRELLEQ